MMFDKIGLKLVQARSFDFCTKCAVEVWIDGFVRDS